MAWIYANGTRKDFRNSGEAVRYAQKAAKLRPNDMEMYETLAAAYVEDGQGARALKTYETVMELGGKTWASLNMEGSFAAVDDERTVGRYREVERVDAAAADR